MPTPTGPPSSQQSGLQTHTGPVPLMSPLVLDRETPLRGFGDIYTEQESVHHESHILPIADRSRNQSFAAAASVMDGYSLPGTVDVPFPAPRSMPVSDHSDSDRETLGPDSDGDWEPSRLVNDRPGTPGPHYIMDIYGTVRRNEAHRRSSSMSSNQYATWQPQSNVGNHPAPAPPPPAPARQVPQQEAMHYPLGPPILFRPPSAPPGPPHRMAYANAPPTRIPQPMYPYIGSNYNVTRPIPVPTSARAFPPAPTGAPMSNARYFGLQSTSRPPYTENETTFRQWGMYPHHPPGHTQPQGPYPQFPHHSNRNPQPAVYPSAQVFPVYAGRAGYNYTYQGHHNSASGPSQAQYRDYHQRNGWKRTGSYY